MDVSFSGKTQQFSLLIHCNSLSPSNKLRRSTSLPSKPQFLGCGHNLRPPGQQQRLRYRRKCGYDGLLRLWSRPRRFVFRTSASLDAQSVILAVSVVAVSALSVVCFEYMKRKGKVKQSSAQVDLAESTKVSSTIDLRTTNEISGHVQLLEETSANENGVAVKEITGEVGHASGDALVQLQYGESTMVTEETLTTATITLPVPHIIACPVPLLEETFADNNEVAVVEMMGEVGHASKDTLQQLQSGESIMVKEETLTPATITLPGAHIIAGPVPLLEETFAGENEVAVEEIIREVGHASKETLEQLQSGESNASILVKEECLTTKTIMHTDSNAIASCVTNSVSSTHSEVTEISQLQSGESILVKEESLTTKTIMHPDSNATASCITDSISSIHSEVTEIPYLPNVLPELAALPFSIAATEMNKLHSRGQHEIESGSELPNLMVKAELIATSAPANTVQAEVEELEKPNHEVVEADRINSYNVMSAEFAPKGLHTFYEATKDNLSSTKNCNGVAKKTNGSVRNKDFSPTSSSTAGENISSHDVLNTAEHIKRKMTFGSYKEGSFDGTKNFRRRSAFPGSEETRTLEKDSESSSPHLSTAQISDYSSQQLRAYNRLLREGRLNESLEKLEYLETKGLLDMDKVYHSGFFRFCKSQKATKEAFRFANLIPNPTLSTFNMLMSVCTTAEDSVGAFRVLELVQKAGLKADSKLYTTLISACAKSKKVDTMFKVFHEMVNAGMEPNGHTYSALIDGCAKAGQVGKAFGAYGIMRSKNVKPDRVVFNALINACGQSGAVARAFDVLSEMKAETHPVDPDHFTIGSLMKACANAGQVDRAKEVYAMIDEYKIKGTPEIYTIAINSCSQTGDWDFACSVYDDMRKKGVSPDEMFLSSLIDVAGHAGKLDAAFEVLEEAKAGGLSLGIVSYSSLMGACCNAKNWQKALELYEDIKTMKLKPVVSMMNALITALCDGNQLPKAVEVFSEMKRVGLRPNMITYSLLVVASEKKDDLEVGLMLLSQVKKDGLSMNHVMCRSLVAMCYRRFEKACMLGEPLLSFISGRLLLDCKWTTLVLKIYRETLTAGVIPTLGELAHVLGCLRLPHDLASRNRLIENLGVINEPSQCSNLCSLIDGFGEYDPRAFSLFEEAASLGIVPSVSLADSTIVVDMRDSPTYIAEVYFLTVLRGLKHRLAAGNRLPNVILLLPIETTEVQALTEEKTVNISGRVNRAVASLLRRLRITYLGSESDGKLRINGVVVKKWLQPKLGSPFGGAAMYFGSSQSKLGKGIADQQRTIRSGNLFFE